MDNYRGGLDYAGLANKARELRLKQTPAEQLLWYFLRDRRFLGLKFRRQHQILGYIVDFFCPSARIVIEVDGGVHKSPGHGQADLARELDLQALGLVVLRFSNEEVIQQTMLVLSSIKCATDAAPGDQL